MAIPLLDLKKQYSTIRDEAMKVTEEIYESQIFILGKKVEAFEKDFASYCHAKHAIGISSGTDALLIALMVLELHPGDEVIVPAYSFFATAGVVHRVGAVPVFVDVEAEGLNLDPDLIEAKITSRTRAIIPVHLYGQTAQMDRINAIAKKHNIVVIEDAAQGVGAELNGVRAGALAPMAAFSFFPSKNLGAFGDAGAVTTDDDDLAQKLLDFRMHGMRPKYYHNYVGGNFRIDALQAAILHVKLAHLESWTMGRQKNAAIYEKLFAESSASGKVLLPHTLPERRHVYNQYIVRFDDELVRDKVMTALRAEEIGCEIYYPLTLPQQVCFKDLPSSSDAYPVSDRAAKTSLAIPIFPELKESELQEIVRVIASVL